MDNNPYAPPVSSVGDVGPEQAFPRSKIVTIIGANAALMGLFWALGGLFSTINKIEQGASIKGTVVLGFWGVIAIAAAIDIFRGRRWAFIVWCVLNAVFLLPAVFFGSFERPIGFIIVGVLAVQFVGSLLGLWVMRSESKRANEAKSEIV